MRTPPEGIEVGDSLTQEEIEDAYNTGFGYRISGINPRRDDHDRRYILLFANEDGPYSDSVTQGRFEYIGEGLEGDQSEDSPGNSALVDAQTSDIPVHFFYKRVEGNDWEYQGLVDVVDYEFQEKDGREVLVFSVEHQPHSEESEDTAENGISHLNERPDSEEIFSAEVVNVDSSGVGYVKDADGNDIVIGPVSCQEGTIVDLEYRGNGYARCMDEPVQAANYDIRFDILKEEYESVPIDIGEEYTGRITESYADSSIAKVNNVHVNTGVGELKVGPLPFRVVSSPPDSDVTIPQNLLFSISEIYP